MPLSSATAATLVLRPWRTFVSRRVASIITTARTPSPSARAREPPSEPAAADGSSSAAASSSAFRAGRVAYDRSATTAAARLRATVAYDGTAYVGWQTQPCGGGVQDALEARLSKLLGGRVYVAGSGRTDKGVHARAQVFHFEPPAELDAGARTAPHLRDALKAGDVPLLAKLLEQTLNNLSSGLPPDIRVHSVTPAPAGFHAREACSGKRYVYTVQEGMGDPMTARHRWVLGRGKRLDVQRMSEAAALLVGTHDFSTFGVRAPSDPRPPVKMMRRLEVRRIRASDPVREAARRATGVAATDAGADGRGETAAATGDDGDDSVVTICAECDRYLYNMMRLISGTLVQVGLGRLTASDVGAMLAAKGRKDAGRGGRQVVKAPPQGLCLERCFYTHEDGEWPNSMFPVPAPPKEESANNLAKPALSVQESKHGDSSSSHEATAAVDLI